jgi:hypothetical protein
MSLSKESPKDDIIRWVIDIIKIYTSQAGWIDSMIKTQGSEIAFSTTRNERLKEAINLCVIIDLTGSMSYALVNIKLQIEKFIGTFSREGRHLNVALIGFRDFGSYTTHFKIFDFMAVDKVLEHFAGYDVADGGDCEDLFGALLATKTLSWSGNENYILAITDIDAHGVGRHDDSYPNAVIDFTELKTFFDINNIKLTFAPCGNLTLSIKYLEKFGIPVEILPVDLNADNAERIENSFRVYSNRIITGNGIEGIANPAYAEEEVHEQSEGGIFVSKFEKSVEIEASVCAEIPNIQDSIFNILKNIQEQFKFEIHLDGIKLKGEVNILNCIVGEAVSLRIIIGEKEQSAGLASSGRVMSI